MCIFNLRFGKKKNLAQGKRLWRVPEERRRNHKSFCFSQFVEKHRDNIVFYNLVIRIDDEEDWKVLKNAWVFILQKFKEENEEVEVSSQN